MKIDPGIQRTNAQDPKKTAQTNAGQETAKTKSNGDPKLRVDKVTISEQARSLQRAEAELKTINDTTSGIRQDKVAQARAKISSGTLITDEVIDQTAEAIIKSGSLSDLINNEHPLIRAKLAETGELESRQDKLAQVRERIASGYYDSPEVTEKIAEEMITDLLG